MASPNVFDACLSLVGKKKKTSTLCIRDSIPGDLRVLFISKFLAITWSLVLGSVLEPKKHQEIRYRDSEWGLVAIFPVGKSQWGIPSEFHSNAQMIYPLITNLPTRSRESRGVFATRGVDHPRSIQPTALHGSSVTMGSEGISGATWAGSFPHGLTPARLEGCEPLVLYTFSMVQLYTWF